MLYQPVQIPAPQTRQQEIRPELSWGNLSLESRKARIHSLAALALQLRAQKLAGVKLWSELTAAAISAYTDLALPTERQCDFVMQDLALVILGPYALKYMDWLSAITPEAIRDPLLKQFYADLGQLGLPPAEPLPLWREAGYMGKLNDLVDPGLDRHFALDFRRELNDHSDNQIFHTFFYQFIAYVSRATLTIRAASVYHELFEQGGSIQDHRAALTGIQVGMLQRRLRDSGAPELEQWPELILAAYAKEAPTDLSEQGQRLRQAVDTLLSHPQALDATLRGIEFGLILIMNEKPAQRDKP